MDGATVVEIGNGTGGVEYPAIVIDPTDGESGGIPTIDPATVAGTESSEGNDTGKRRGRPRGSKNFSGSNKQPQKEVSSDIATLLWTTHFFLAKIAKVEELELEKDEAEELGKALARVQKEFGVSVLSPKAMALMQLAIVAGGIYTPRVIAFSLNKKPKEEKPKIAVMPSMSNNLM
jgi:hypothetical protein